MCPYEKYFVILTVLVFLTLMQTRLCHSWASCDLGWNTAGWSEHQFHQQPILWLHNHKAGWKVRKAVANYYKDVLHMDE